MKKQAILIAVFGLSVLGSPASADPLGDAKAGMEALNRGDNASAIRSFTQAISSGKLAKSDKELAYVKRAEAYLASGQNVQALADANRALVLDASDAEASDVRDKAQPASAGPFSSAAIQAAVADPARPDKDRARDAARKPAELIAFGGVKRGDVVVDVMPGTGYWSRMFSTIVGPSGTVYAYVPQEIAGFNSNPVGVAEAMAAEPGRGNVQVKVHPLVIDNGPANVFDVVWIFQNYHDLHDSFMQGADVDAYNRMIFKALKPGGVFVIIDHAAEAGSGLKHTEDQHRIDPAAVRAEVEKAGFVFDGETKILANPADPHTALVFDPSIRGKTDQFAYRFKKPS